jgi:hypothetical protein
MARVKKKAHENLTDVNLRKVISLLVPPSATSNGPGKKPITKKEACSILNITYNTTRLGKIIDEFQEKEAFVAKRKAQNRGKRASEGEITEVIGAHLQGDPISQIAAGLYRSSGFVRGIIERVGVPTRPNSAEARAKVGLLPDSCIAESFGRGEVVWSAKYHAPAVVKKPIAGLEDKYLGTCYQVYVMERVDATDSYFPYVEHGGFNAYCPFYDLGKLEHLEQFGISLKNIS